MQNTLQKKLREKGRVFTRKKTEQPPRTKVEQKASDEAMNFEWRKHPGGG